MESVPHFHSLADLRKAFSDHSTVSAPPRITLGYPATIWDFSLVPLRWQAPAVREGYGEVPPAIETHLGFVGLFPSGEAAWHLIVATKGGKCVYTQAKTDAGLSPRLLAECPVVLGIQGSFRLAALKEVWRAIPGMKGTGYVFDHGRWWAAIRDGQAVPCTPPPPSTPRSPSTPEYEVKMEDTFNNIQELRKRYPPDGRADAPNIPGAILLAGEKWVRAASYINRHALPPELSKHPGPLYNHASKTWVLLLGRDNDEDYRYWEKPSPHTLDEERYPPVYLMSSVQSLAVFERTGFLPRARIYLPLMRPAEGQSGWQELSTSGPPVLSPPVDRLAPPPLAPPLAAPSTPIAAPEPSSPAAGEDNVLPAVVQALAQGAKMRAAREVTNVGAEMAGELLAQLGFPRDVMESEVGKRMREGLSPLLLLALATYGDALAPIPPGVKDFGRSTALLSLTAISYDSSGDLLAWGREQVKKLIQMYATYTAAQQALLTEGLPPAGNIAATEGERTAGQEEVKS